MLEKFWNGDILNKVNNPRDLVKPIRWCLRTSMPSLSHILFSLNGMCHLVWFFKPPNPQPSLNLEQIQGAGPCMPPPPPSTNSSDLAMPMHCQCLIFYGLQCNILVSMSLSLLSPMQQIDFNTSLQLRPPNFLGSNLPEFFFSFAFYQYQFP